MTLHRLKSWMPMAVAALVGTSSVPAQAQSEGELLSRARQAVNARDSSAALQALDAADKARGRSAGYVSQFLRGAALQDQARAATTPEERKQATSQAIGAYRGALDALASPDAATQSLPTEPARLRGPILNNLALLAAGEGDDDAARRWFDEAVKQPDERASQYAINYARYLEARDPEAAIRVASGALKTAPDNLAVRGVLDKLYARSASDERLAPFLAQSVQGGYTLWGMAAALDELAAAPSRPQAQRDQLLIVVAAALARETSSRPSGIDPQSMKDVSAKLDALGGDPQLGSGARQLRQVLVEPPATMSALSWWSRSSPSVGSPALSPRTAMRELAVALGLQSGARDRQRAERLFRLAISGGEQGPDADAFLRLVELYVNTDQSSRLKPLMDQYQWELFSEKSAEYARGNWSAIYRLHLALGMTYAEMKVWKSDTPYQNAIFQLSNASMAADRVNAMKPPPGQPKATLALPASAALKLSEGYLAVGQPEQAAKVKLEGALKLHEAQRVTESRDLFKTIGEHEVVKLRPEDRSKYNGLKAAVPG